MADDGYQFQASPIVGGVMLNIRADNYPEFEGALSDLADGAEGIASKLAIITAVGNLIPATHSGGSTGHSGGSNSGSSGSSGGGDSTPLSQVPEPARWMFTDAQDKCDHGKRVFREGGSWKALFCCLPSERKSEQCSPEWGDKKRKKG